MSPALAERNAQIHLPKKLRRRRGDVCKDASFGLLSLFCSQKILPPPTVQTNLGGRNFASCVALGRIFGATFRNACPPTRAQLRPLRPKAAEQSRAQAGGQRQRLRRNTYPGQRKTRSVSDFRSWPTSPDKKKYTHCDNLAKACTFFCPGLAFCKQ